MALEVRSIDEELTRLADIYDDLIAPKRIKRTNNNKLYLLLRAVAAGNVGLNDTAIALHDRFNPRSCEETDLYSVAKLVGTDFMKGKGSLLDITVTNVEEETKTLPIGIYKYKSPSGDMFTLDIINDITLEPLGSSIVTAVSDEKGVFPVNRISSIQVTREDETDIDEALTFSCEDNGNQLGYDDESTVDFRARILNDTERKDAIKKLELAIRNLPTIFECTLVFNSEVNDQEYDGITLKGKELLIVITGAPSNEIARHCSELTVYDTHMVDPDKVVWYENDLYINGKRPVYYTNHAAFDFSLAVEYQYAPNRVRPIQVEAAITALFKPYMNSKQFISMFSEKDAYSVASKLDLVGVTILNIDIINSDGEVVPFVNIPKTRLPNLTGIEFTAREAGGA